MRNGASEPIRAALATLLCVAPAKNTARFSPKNTPGTTAWRTSAAVTRRPVDRRYTLNTTVAMVSRQNATSTPGVSARFTSVELNEKPMTTPTTARAPSVCARSSIRRGSACNGLLHLRRSTSCAAVPAEGQACSSGSGRCKGGLGHGGRYAGPTDARAVERVRPVPHDHLVHLYRTEDELDRAIGDHLLEGFREAPPVS